MKNLTKPIPLLQAEALERRLRIDHEKMPEIKNNIKILKSGYNGEREINYQLGQIPQHKYHIFHDLRLPIGETFFQIDALLLSSYILINLDGKNHSGKITIEKNQMIQEAFEKREIYENPVSQVNRHKILLRNWIEDNQLPRIFMDNLVCFSRSSSEIIITPGYREAENKICKTHDLIKKIEELEGYHKKVWVSEQDILKISNLLFKKHAPKRIDLLKFFQVPESDIIIGVQCPACLFAPMIYNRNKWICPTCQLISKDAHIRAIYDYFRIFKPWFTNSEIRNFLNMSSPRAVVHLLSPLKLTRVGYTSDTVYHQPKLFP
ncbi:nuclease-related domain-containing protein [Neobacillus sp. NPDC093182]|uniref:nuclease-related domain-containing protein n=1 Tax=Neobacillus sp. NPDC093182 TaxID=3364297 RepID=UPI00381B2294